MLAQSRIEKEASNALPFRTADVDCLAVVCLRLHHESKAANGQQI